MGIGPYLASIPRALFGGNYLVGVQEVVSRGLVDKCKTEQYLGLTNIYGYPYFTS